MAENGFSLGTAWVQISPSLKGFRSSVEKEIGGVDTSRAERTITGRIGGAFKQAAKIGSIALGAVSTVALTAGLASVASEAISASDATDKFRKTLEFAGKSKDDIVRLSASTKDYADKTVYDLSDIQNITAQLASNNVEGFDRLAEAAGNLNAVAGGNKDTFRSVGMVLTQTAGQGKLTTENWNQLADAIPGASGKIQEALLAAGAYTGDFRDQMSKGEITAQEFNQAILDLGFSQAAEEAATSTSTIEGAWGNLQAALVSGGMDIVNRIKPALTEFMGTVATGAESAFQWIQESLIPSLSSMWDILAKGDFTGGIFGFEEDSGLVDFLFRVRDAAMQAGDWLKNTFVPGVQEVWNILYNGDFTGNLFGLEEDSGIVTFLFNIRDAAIQAGDWIKNTLMPSAQGIVDIVTGNEVSGPIFGLSPDSTIVDFISGLRDGMIEAGKAALDLTNWLIENKTTVVALAAPVLTIVAAWKTYQTILGVVLGVQKTYAAVTGLVAAAKQAYALGTYGQATAEGSFTTVVFGAIGALKTKLATLWASVSAYASQGLQIALSTARMVAYNVATGAARVGTTLYTAAQWALNAALNANPIALIIIALVALGAAIVVAYQKSETFRNIVNAAWAGIKAGAAVVVDWFVANVLPTLSTVWEGIKAGASLLWDALKTGWDGIKAGAAAVVDWFSTYVQPTLSTVWSIIKFGFDLFVAVMQIGWGVIKLVVSTVVDWFSTWVGSTLSTVWEYIKLGILVLQAYFGLVWQGIKATVNVVVGWFQSYVQPVISLVWEGIKLGANLLWVGIQAAWNGIQAGVGLVVGWFNSYVKPGLDLVWTGIKAGADLLWTGIQTAWNGIKSSVNAVKDWFANTVEPKMKTITENIKSAFDTMKTGIETVWNGVKAAAAKPINFVIGTVYNDGIKKVADSIAEKLGLETRLPAASKIPGYASGGVLPGYSPGKDIYHFFSPDGGGALALSGGEAIMRPEWVRAVGGRRAVNAMNAAATSGARILPGGDLGRKAQFAAFAKGGIWDKIKDSVSSGIGAASDWIATAADAAATIISDPVGAVTNLIRTPVDALMNLLPGSGLFADMAKKLPYSWIDGLGEFFKKEALTATSSDIVNAARRAVAMGVPYVWGGSSIPPGLDCSGLVYWAAHQMGATHVPRLTAAGYQAASTPGGNINVPGTLLFWGSPAWHVAIASGNGMMIEEPRPGLSAREVPIWGSPTAGVYKFDEGGWLEPGFTNVVNKTGRPEAVFTASQFDKIDRILSYLENETQKTLILVDADNELIGRMRAEADGRIIEAQALGL